MEPIKVWLGIIIIVTPCFILGCGKRENAPEGGAEASSAEAQQLTDANDSTTESTPPQSALSRVDSAIEDYHLAIQRINDTLAQQYDQAITDSATQGDLETAQRLTASKEAVAESGGSPPTPDAARAWHQALIEKAKAVQACVEAYQNAIDQATRAVKIEEATQLQAELKTFIADSGIPKEVLPILADPTTEWHEGEREFTVDAKNDSQASKIWTPTKFTKGDVVYLFPNPDDRWNVAKGGWVDYRGRIGAKRPPQATLGCRIFGHESNVSMGKRQIFHADGKIGLFCRDQWPSNNQGAIRIKLVAFSPRDKVFVDIPEDEPAPPAPVTSPPESDQPQGEEDAPAKSTDTEPLSDLIPLDCGSPLPSYLRVSRDATTDLDGLVTGMVQTRATDMIDKDFVFDVIYEVDAQAAEVFFAGIGSPTTDDRNHSEAVGSRVHGPGSSGGVATFFRSGLSEEKIGHLPTPGIKVFQMSKVGDQVTMSIGKLEGGHVVIAAKKSLPDIHKVASYLNRYNSSLYIKHKFTGHCAIKAIRLQVDGHVLKPESTSTTAFTPDDNADWEALGAGVLPGWVIVEGSGEAKRGAYCLDRDSRLLMLPNDIMLSEHDYVMDIEFRFDPESRVILNTGLMRQDGNRQVYPYRVRVHGPGYGGKVDLAVTGVREQEIGSVYTEGPHLLRVSKHGGTLTSAISINYDGKYRPDLIRSVPDFLSNNPDVTEGPTSFYLSGEGVLLLRMRSFLDGLPIVSLKLPTKLLEKAQIGVTKQVKLTTSESPEDYSLVSGPAGAAISNEAVFTWTPTADQLGTHRLVIMRSDDHKVALASQMVTVVNTSPENHSNESHGAPRPPY